MGLPMEFPALDFSKIRTYPLRERANKVDLSAFATPHRAGMSFRDWLAHLPKFLAAADLLAVRDRIVTAVRSGRPVLLMMGAHAIKVGLNPIIVDQMRAGVISAVAFNGAGAIHDFELAYQGGTSEDVQAGLDDGTFGMVEETGRLMNAALEAGVAQGLGAGRALGEAILKAGYPHRDLSILHTGVECGVPVTSHIAIGTDIIHQHPAADGAILGEATHLDFQRLAGVVSQLEGGVVLNVGSAVIMPEVFLKALTVARNLGHTVSKFTAANLDMIRHYRPSENVVKRPTRLGGEGFSITGHHELMLPLLFAAVREELGA
jgi:hypothetical protein